VEDPAEVRVDHDPPVLVRHARNQSVAGDTGVVDQDVEVSGRSDECVGLLRVGDVRLDGAGARFLRYRFSLVSARAVAERDVRAGTRELEGDRTPDAPRPARDEGGLSFERRKWIRQKGVSPRACRFLRA
jgi:hypothetical protein